MATTGVERNKKKRSAYIRSATKLMDTFYDSLDNEYFSDLPIIMNTFHNKVEKIRSLNDEILDQLRDDDMEQDIEEATAFDMMVNQIEEEYKEAMLEDEERSERCCSPRKLRTPSPRKLRTPSPRKLRTPSPRQSRSSIISPNVNSTPKPFEQPEEAKVKVPIFPLQKFSGEPTEWRSFYDTFNASVHSNIEISNIDKFYYLKSLLTGEASKTIRQLNISGENYKEALQMLQNRFGIPKFSGKPTEWGTFYEAFDKSVHSAKELTSVDKFTSLKTLVIGDALKVIQHLSLTADNYDRALRLLQERFAIPKFSGNPTEWRTFYESFYASVHLSRDFTSTEKFAFLKSLVTDIAEKTIEDLSITALNYDKALRTLVDRFSVQKFGGNPREWRDFFESFIKVVHSCEEITSIDKFSYLKSLVTGEALKTIQDLRTTADNYHKSLNLLQDRFTIQEFNGKSTEWRSFYESFNKAVHSSNELTNIEKFTYLKSLLADEAANAIQDLALTAPNYDKALKVLEDRFGIPKYNGSPIEWMPFYEAFDKSVHSAKELTSVEKLKYLKSLVIGDAAKTIDYLSLTAENYEKALGILKKRFGITKFSGKPTEWNSFFEAYKKVIHTSHDISTIDKFAHLKSLVTDEAAKTIQELSLTEDNYEKALKLLQQHFEIKKFNGEPTEWKSFYEAFKKALHSSGEVSNMNKFVFLKSLLTGEAAKTVQDASFTNYEKAVKLLQDRFGNEQVIISSHMKILLKLGAIKNGRDSTGLRKLYDEIESNCRSLSSMGIDDYGYGALLAPVVMEKLPADVRTRISDQMEEHWKMDTLLALLKVEIEGPGPDTKHTKEKSEESKNIDRPSFNIPPRDWRLSSPRSPSYHSPSRSPRPSILDKYSTSAASYSSTLGEIESERSRRTSAERSWRRENSIEEIMRKHESPERESRKRELSVEEILRKNSPERQKRDSSISSIDEILRKRSPERARREAQVEEIIRKHSPERTKRESIEDILARVAADAPKVESSLEEIRKRSPERPSSLSGSLAGSRPSSRRPSVDRTISRDHARASPQGFSSSSSSRRTSEERHKIGLSVEDIIRKHSPERKKPESIEDIMRRHSPERASSKPSSRSTSPERPTREASIEVDIMRRHSPERASSRPTSPKRDPSVEDILRRHSPERPSSRAGSRPGSRRPSVDRPPTTINRKRSPERLRFGSPERPSSRRPSIDDRPPTPSYDEWKEKQKAEAAAEAESGTKVEVEVYDYRARLRRISKDRAAEPERPKSPERPPSPVKPAFERSNSEYKAAEEDDKQERAFPRYNFKVHRGFDDFLKELKSYRADLETTTTTSSRTAERPAKIERSKTEYRTEYKSRSSTLGEVPTSVGRDLSKYDYTGRLGGSLERASARSSTPVSSDRPSFERSTTEYKSPASSFSSTTEPTTSSRYDYKATESATQHSTIERVKRTSDYKVMLIAAESAPKPEPHNKGGYNKVSSTRDLDTTSRYTSSSPSPRTPTLDLDASSSTFSSSSRYKPDEVKKGAFPDEKKKGAFPDEKKKGGFPDDKKKGAFPDEKKKGGLPDEKKKGGFPELVSSDKDMHEAVERVLFGMHAGLRHPRSEYHVILGGKSGADCARYFTQGTGKEKAMQVYFNIAINEIPRANKDVIVDISERPGKVKIRNCDRFFRLIKNEYDMICLRIGQYQDFIEGSRAQAALSKSYDSSAAQRKLSSVLQYELSVIKAGGGYSDFSIEDGSISLLKNGQMWLNISLDMHIMIQINWWPPAVEEWRSRDRVWPPRDVVNRLCEKCYLTRKPSDGEKFDFSYSFYNIERELTNRMSHRQKIIYFKFKALIYKYVDPVDPDNIPDALGKTIMLFALEFRGPEDALWKQDKFALKYLFNEFVKTVEDGEFPDYFIPAINLMSGIQSIKKDQIRKQLYEIIQNIEKFVDNLAIDDAVKFYNDVTSACQKIATCLGNKKTIGL